MSARHISEEEVARYWDGNADLWAEQVRQRWDAYREYWNNPAFMRFLGSLKGKNVFDAGCGEGYNTRILARRGARMTGIDISRKMIAHARETERQEPLGIRYRVASFADLSIFAGASFDTVVSTMALMDSPDYEKAVEEIFRVLRPQGDFFFSVTHPCFMTPGFGWVRDDTGRKVKLTVSGYFEKKHWVEHWGFSHAPDPKKETTPLFAVPRFDRMLADYINPLVRAGFVLRRLGEPKPSDGACREHAFLRRWRENAALFLYVHAVKP